MMAKGNTLVVDVRDAPEVEKSGKIAGAVNVSRGMLEFRADPMSRPTTTRILPRDKAVDPLLRLRQRRSALCRQGTQGHRLRPGLRRRCLQGTGPKAAARSRSRSNRATSGHVVLRWACPGHLRPCCTRRRAPGARPSRGARYCGASALLLRRMLAIGARGKHSGGHRQIPD